MIRNEKKHALLITALLLISACAWFGPVAGSSGASYSIYVKTAGGWAIQEELHPAKYYETASVDLSMVLPDVDGDYKVRIAQQGGIAAHIDYVALLSGASALAPVSVTCIDDGRDILQKAVSLDNDVADAAGRTIECVWAADGSSAPVLLCNANQELYTVEAPLLTPFSMTPELMLPYTLHNNGKFAGDGVPDTVEADFLDYWTPTSGHPWGYTYLWLRSDGEYLYAIMEVTADNTYDETGWGSLYVAANGALKEFRVDTTSREYGADRFVYTATVPWQHMVYAFKIPLAEIGAALDDNIKIGFGSYGTASAISAEKVVLNPETNQWVKELTAKIGDTVRFSCTINNPTPLYMSSIRVWDHLDCSLQYQNGSLTVYGYAAPVEIPDDDGPDYRFKQKMLHPDSATWNLSNPIDAWFTELCPNVSTQRQLKDWKDRDYDTKVSAQDEIQLTSIPGKWYHVDRMPYTLNLSNATYGTRYFDSVLNWDTIDLSAPIATEWLEVCCCKDTYTIVSWTNSGCPYLDSGDLVTLQNARTQEEMQYTVEEVVKDLVVSREYLVDDYYPGFILEPYQNITILYNATVMCCGVDNNTFGVGANYSLSQVTYFYQAYEDTVTITVPCPEPATREQVPAFTHLSLIALFGLLSIVALSTLIRKKKR